MPIDLSHRMAVVTGGTDGIGRASAVSLARHGARMWAADSRHRRENNALFESLAVTQLACDVRSEADAWYDESSMHFDA